MKRLWINSSDAFILVGSVDQPDSLAKIKKLRQSILEERELVCKGVDANEQAADLLSSDMLKTTVDRQNSNNSQATQITSTRSPNSPQPFQHLLSKLLDFSHHRRKRHHELIQQLPDPQIRSNSTTTIQHNNKTNPSSARRTSTWSAEEVLRTRRIRNPPVVIVWNKQDLPQDKQQFSVYELEAISLVEWNYGFVRASAYDNMKIEDIFRQVLEQARQPPELGECMIRKRHISQQPPK